MPAAIYWEGWPEGGAPACGFPDPGVRDSGTASARWERRRRETSHAIRREREKSIAAVRRSGRARRGSVARERGFVRLPPEVGGHAHDLDADLEQAGEILTAATGDAAQGRLAGLLVDHAQQGIRTEAEETSQMKRRERVRRPRLGRGTLDYCRLARIMTSPRSPCMSSSALPTIAPRARSESVARMAWPGTVDVVRRSPARMGPLTLDARQ